MRIITIHGIRKQENWDEIFKNLNAVKSAGVQVDNFNYGYFSLWQFLMPWSRQKVYKEFQKWYSDNITSEEPPPSAICHSFGTYILLTAIKKYDSIKFDKVIFCGSILNTNTDFSSYFNRDQIKMLYNDYGTLDKFVRYSPLVIPGYCGKAGKAGFRYTSYEKVINRQNYFDHSEYFLPIHMEKHWLGVLTQPKIVPTPSNINSSLPISPLKNYKYDEKILRKEIFERIHANINLKNEITYESVEYCARVDEKGNYYAKYIKEGINNSIENLLSYCPTTTADSTQTHTDMDFQAFDSSGKFLQSSIIEDSIQNKKFRIDLNSEVAPKDRFYVQYLFMWKETINTSLGDTDHFGIKNTQKVKIYLNFKHALTAARFFIVNDNKIVNRINATVRSEKDRTSTYCLEYENEQNYDGVIFYFEKSKSQPSTMIKSPAYLTQVADFISKAVTEDIKQIYSIECGIEHSNAASENTLIDRLAMFNDGFLVAKPENKVAGYIESVLWDDKDFETFEEIKNFPIHYNPNGDTLYIIFIAVKKEERRKGIGKLLLDAIDRIALRFNVKQIKLVAKDDLVNYYNRFGFVAIKELPRFLHTTDYKSVLMCKSLE